MKDLSDFRVSYEKYILSEESLFDDPLILFKEWFEQICDSKQIKEPNAMTLSTVDENNTPNNRIVLLKKFSKDGFIFYTNYLSNKGKSISNNANVCLSFFWPSHERQVIIKGKCIFMSKKESDKYFYSRPIDSQVGAIASDQSSEIPNRKYIVDKFDVLKKKHTKIVRPDHWGGVIVQHETIEFWQGRKNRLHDRIFFSKLSKGKWTYSRLSP
tara:strand:- start:5185 stop:5823 length:639 start_codon:yes stop_codon:yes gene_type:complete